MAMKTLVRILVVACALVSVSFAFQNSSADAPRWAERAKNVTIIRDDWGIAHVFGKTDADTVFGAIYAQAEDDFNRVENNYMTQLGRQSEAEGESRIFSD